MIDRTLHMLFVVIMLKKVHCLSFRVIFILVISLWFIVNTAADTMNVIFHNRTKQALIGGPFV